MTRYEAHVYGRTLVEAWLTVEAETEEEAVAKAEAILKRGHSKRGGAIDWEIADLDVDDPYVEIADPLQDGEGDQPDE